MLKRTPLKRAKRLNPMSLKKIRELNAEAPVRIALCERAGGTPVKCKQTYYVKGKSYPVTAVQCWGGICECGCGERTDGLLEPHEKVFRSRGGKLSMGNTIMVKRAHHNRLQNNETQWRIKETRCPPCLGNMMG